MAVLTAHNLTIGYRQRNLPEKVVADKLSVSLMPNELVCLLGPNGSGKTTLLRTLAGMLPAINGKVELLGDDITQLPPRTLARRLSVVLTDQVNVGNLSAYDLVSLGRYPHTNWLGSLTGDDEAIIRQSIAAVGAEGLANRDITELSDGERQKVMIARALAQASQVMMLDEPTAFLDLPHRVEVMQILRDLAWTTGSAVLLSTHDLDLALRSADRIWLIDGDGQLHIGAPEDLILSGAFQHVFRGRGVEFDMQSGSFKIGNGDGIGVNLYGDGLVGLWTQRALTRAGYAVATEAATSMGEAELGVEVIGHNGSTTWRTRIGTSVDEHHSIHALIRFLKTNTAGEFNSHPPGN